MSYYHTFLNSVIYSCLQFIVKEPDFSLCLAKQAPLTANPAGFFIAITTFSNFTAFTMNFTTALYFQTLSLVL